ncbi:MAG: hypothetical protein ABW128_16940 [Rhizorhabdus sp.]
MQRVADYPASGQIDPFAEVGAGRNRASVMRRAMLTNRCVSFYYADKLRMVEVHAIGRSPKDGSLVMRGYQIAGKASRPLPQWTLFTVEKMSGLAILEAITESPRDGYTMGDSQMAVLSELKV